MPAASSGRSLRHWSVFVPLVALAGFGAAWLAHDPPPPRSLDIQLTPPAQAELSEIAIPARVRFLRGRVVEQGGTPVADALVWVLSGDEPRWTYTDGQGGFELTRLRRGPWDLRVLAARHLPFAIALSDTGAPQEIRLPDERREPPRLADLPRAPLAGTIVGATGDEVAGAEIVLTPVHAPEEIDAPLPRRALADAGGRFLFPELIAGEYHVEVLPAWARGGTWPDLLRALHAPRELACVHRADGSAPLTLRLASGSARGELADAEGRAPEGALVLLAPAAAPGDVWPPRTSDARGAFAFEALPAGRYALRARAGATSWSRELEVLPGRTTDLGRIAP